MKKALFILALVICLTFSACGDTPIDQHDSPSLTDGSQDVSVPVDSMPDDAYGNSADTQADSDGEVIPYGKIQTDMYLSSEKRVNGDGTVSEVKYTYDSEGRLLSAIRSDGGGTKHEYPDYSTEITYYLSEGGEIYQKQVCEYDGKHQPLSSICYDGNGNLRGNGVSYSNIYSEPNMISQIRYYTTDLEHYETVNYEYSDGKVISRIHKDENGETVWEYSERLEYSQDEDGNTVTVCYNGDGETPSYKSIYNSEDKMILDIVYDDIGNEVSRTEVTIDGSKEVSTTYFDGVIDGKYETVDGRNVRSETYDSEGKLSEYATYEYTDTTTTISYYSADGSLVRKYDLTNGADGRPISYSCDGEENETFSTVYTYDENNCLIKEETVSDNPSESYVVTYEYTKIEGVFRRMGETDNRG